MIIIIIINGVAIDSRPSFHRGVDVRNNFARSINLNERNVNLPIFAHKDKERFVVIEKVVAI